MAELNDTNKKGRMLMRFSKYRNSVLAGLFSVIAIGWFHSINTDDIVTGGKYEPPTLPVPLTPAEIDAQTIAALKQNNPSYPLPEFIAKALPEGDYDSVRTRLMNEAALAVRNEDRLELANQLALLGAAALSDSDLDTAEVYLDEALAVYEEQGDQLGIGSVELLRGRVSLVEREEARDAAYAYDKIQLAGWSVAKSRFSEAEDAVQEAIDENLRLDRTAAAAAGYEMLERGYRSEGNLVRAQEVAVEAMLLHAASGRSLRAEAALESLENSGMSYEDIQLNRQRIKAAQREYEYAIHQVGKARDFEQLYHHFINEGDPVQAWQFRLKANDSLAKASKRAMHRRQTGIIALLYNSNDSRREARASFNRARDLFILQERDDLIEHADAATEQIY